MRWRGSFCGIKYRLCFGFVIKIMGQVPCEISTNDSNPLSIARTRNLQKTCLTSILMQQKKISIFLNSAFILKLTLCCVSNRQVLILRIPSSDAYINGAWHLLGYEDAHINKPCLFSWDSEYPDQVIICMKLGSDQTTLCNCACDSRARKQLVLPFLCHGGHLKKYKSMVINTITFQTSTLQFLLYTNPLSSPSPF